MFVQHHGGHRVMIVLASRIVITAYRISDDYRIVVDTADYSCDECTECVKIQLIPSEMPRRKTVT